jgi:hypothetical protein
MNTYKVYNTPVTGNNDTLIWSVGPLDEGGDSCKFREGNVYTLGPDGVMTHTVTLLNVCGGDFAVYVCTYTGVVARISRKLGSAED